MIVSISQERPQPGRRHRQLRHRAGLTVLQLQQLALFQAARVAPRLGFVLGAGRSTSAGTPKRVRSRWIIDMLSPFLPRRTSLTRLAVPRIGIMSARESPC